MTISRRNGGRFDLIRKEMESESKVGDSRKYRINARGSEDCEASTAMKNGAAAFGCRPVTGAR
ncbi:hypothetical protein [Burkholderia gladioli]|uniref:hypothetical protein n=1 Tax=Burkholderia gladioli TaxID=28095 RepID=UPI0016417756|nr:hypothetical protein [Burkholderia gladioli]